MAKRSKRSRRRMQQSGLGGRRRVRQLAGRLGQPVHDAPPWMAEQVSGISSAWPLPLGPPSLNTR